jgi:hypothetical protein
MLAAVGQEELTMASLTWSALTSSTSQVMFCAATQPSAHPFQHAMQTQAIAAYHMPHWLRRLLEHCAKEPPMAGRAGFMTIEAVIEEVSDGHEQGTFSPQKSSISWVSLMPPMRLPAMVSLQSAQKHPHTLFLLRMASATASLGPL